MKSATNRNEQEDAAAAPGARSQKKICQTLRQRLPTVHLLDSHYSAAECPKSWRLRAVLSVSMLVKEFLGKVWFALLAAGKA